MNKFYVLREFRNGESPSGFDAGKVSRFGTFAEAEANGEKLARSILPTNPYDRVIVGAGPVRNGRPIGSGKRLCVYGSNRKA